jgi:hypothetical protein
LGESQTKGIGVSNVAGEGGKLGVVVGVPEDGIVVNIKWIKRFVLCQYPRSYCVSDFGSICANFTE